MAERGGQPGNNNAGKAKDWANALRWAVDNYENAQAGITRGQALRKVAETCLVQALAGDKDARAELGNRLDGKVAQAIIGGDEGDNPIRIEAIAIKLVKADGT